MKSQIRLEIINSNSVKIHKGTNLLSMEQFAPEGQTYNDKISITIEGLIKKKTTIMPSNAFN